MVAGKGRLLAGHTATMNKMKVPLIRNRGAYLRYLGRSPAASAMVEHMPYPLFRFPFFYSPTALALKISKQANQTNKQNKQIAFLFH